MGSEIIPTIDLINDSLKNLLGVSFAKSSSPVYPLAVSVAQGAKMYEELKLGGSTVHMAIFEKNRDGAARAMSLLQYISEWRSTQIYAGGKLLQNYYRVSQVLRCYLEATACDDWRAHCHVVIDDPYYEATNSGVMGFTVVHSPYQSEPHEQKMIDRYIFPCCLLQHDFHHKTSEHPAEAFHQIQAEAISIGCDICPYFNAKDYAKIGQKPKFY